MGVAAAAAGAACGPEGAAAAASAAAAAAADGALGFVAWVSMWLLRLVLCVKVRPQPSIGQVNGLFPVCVRPCVRRLKSSENLLPHPGKPHCGGG